jgi:hypothetical protein
MSEMTYAVHTATCIYLLDDDGICRWTIAPGGRAAPGADRAVGAQFVACLDLSVDGGLVGELRVGTAALFVRHEEGRFALLRTLPIQRVEYRGEEPAPEPEPEPAPAPIEDEHSFAETPIFPREPVDLPPPYPPPILNEPTSPLSQTAPLPDLFEDLRATAPFTMGPQAAPNPAPPVAAQTMPVERATERLPAWSLPEMAPPSDSEPIDIEEELSISVSEVTLTLPLYRRPLPPPTALPPPHPAPHAYPAQLPPDPRYSVPAGGAGPQRRSVVGPGRRLR